MGRKNSAGVQDRQLMTLEQAAVVAGVSVRTLARYRKLGTLDVTRIGRRVLCTVDAIERAIVRRSPQQIGREALAAERDTDPLSNWLDLLQELATTTPDFEAPEVLGNYIREIQRRFPAAEVRDLTVAELRPVHASIVLNGTASGLVAAILAAPAELTVREALSQLRRRFLW